MSHLRCSAHNKRVVIQTVTVLDGMEYNIHQAHQNPFSKEIFS